MSDTIVRIGIILLAASAAGGISMGIPALADSAVNIAKLTGVVTAVLVYVFWKPEPQTTTYKCL